MEHLESVEEARWMVEQSTKKVNLDEIGHEVNATHEQEQLDSLYEGVVEHPDFVHLDTDGINIENGGTHILHQYLKRSKFRH